MKQGLESAAKFAALATLAPELADAFAALASDIALVIDSHGNVSKVALGGGHAITPGTGEWIGKPWVETVTGDTRKKIEDLLREVGSAGVSRRREINLPMADGSGIPVSYTAVRLGLDGPVLAVGRDLRAVSGIQQQFVQAQQEIEREYWKHRQDESRYRVLFQIATDAVLVVDSQSLAIIDANNAASELFDITLQQLIGMDAVATIDRASRPAVGELLATARATGLPGEIRAWLAGRRISSRISATPFRSGDSMLLLVRARRADAGMHDADASAALARFVERTPDSVVVVDAAGRILMANPAFLSLCQYPDESHLRGRPLDELLGTAFETVIATAKIRGIAARQNLNLRGRNARITPVEVSAALLAEEEQECIGLTIRARGTEDMQTSQGALHGTLAAAIDSLTAQVGQFDLPELLAKVAEQAEQLFVQKAMQLSERDPAQAAKILGVSASRLNARLAGGLESTPHPGNGKDPRAQGPAAG